MQCQKITKTTLGLLPLILFTSSHACYAASIDISYGQQEYQLNLQDETITLSPVGYGVAVSTDLTEHFSLNLNYQDWQDDKNHDSKVNASADITTLGTSLNYYLDNWSFSTSYSQSKVDTLISGLKRKNNLKNENSDSSSLGASIGYGFTQNNWFYGILVSGLYSDWEFDKYQFKEAKDQNAEPKITTEKRSGDSSSISSSLSAAYYIPLKGDTGLMLGGLFSWHYLLSGDSILISRNGREINTRPNNTSKNITTNSAALNSISGDDSYGQIALYASYDINEFWAFDLDTSVNIASIYDAYTWSISLGYVF